jgi:hypothetical protein
MTIQMPSIRPLVPPDLEPIFAVWALVHACGGTIAIGDLVRAFALWSTPPLLARLARGDVAETARMWAERVAGRRVAADTLSGALYALATRDGVQLSAVAVSATKHTPPDEALDEWHRFEARLALRVMDELQARRKR